MRRCVGSDSPRPVSKTRDDRRGRVRSQDAAVNRKMVANLVLGDIKRSGTVFPEKSVLIDSAERRQMRLWVILKAILSDLEIAVP